MSEKNDESAELSQLEEALAKKEHKLQALYCQMGKSILELAQGGQKTVDAMVDDIISTRRRILTIKHETQCLECMSYNPDNSRYCRHCGAFLKLQSEKENENESQ